MPTSSGAKSEIESLSLALSAAPTTLPSSSQLSSAHVAALRRFQILQQHYVCGKQSLWFASGRGLRRDRMQLSRRGMLIFHSSAIAKVIKYPKDTLLGLAGDCRVVNIKANTTWYLLCVPQTAAVWEVVAVVSQDGTIETRTETIDHIVEQNNTRDSVDGRTSRLTYAKRVSDDKLVRHDTTRKQRTRTAPAHKQKRKDTLTSVSKVLKSQKAAMSAGPQPQIPQATGVPPSLSLPNPPPQPQQVSSGPFPKIYLPSFSQQMYSSDIHYTAAPFFSPSIPPPYPYRYPFAQSPVVSPPPLPPRSDSYTPNMEFNPVATFPKVSSVSSVQNPGLYLPPLKQVPSQEMIPKQDIKHDSTGDSSTRLPSLQSLFTNGT